jgi:penicillin-binding protein 2
MSSNGFAENGGSRDLRTRVLMVLMSACVLLLAVRLFSMQVMQGDIYGSRAEEVARQTQVITAKRGIIYDRSYDAPIVSNYDVYNLVMNPVNQNERQISTMLEKLSSHLGIPLASLKKKLPSGFKLYHPVELVSGIKYQDIVYIAEHKDEFEGLSWENRPMRLYPQGSSMAHVLGYVGEITTGELQVLYNRGYSEKSIIGKAGIEKTYDAKMRGKDGKRLRRVDARGQGIENGEVVDVPPDLGNNLVLTLDRNIQSLAQRALGKRIGSIVVLKPATGEILAMVSYPSYDPNQFYTEQSSAAFKRLANDSRSPFLNRNVQSAAPPASTFKILMSTAVLEENAFPATNKILCNGSVQFGNRVFHCHLRNGHGLVDLEDAMAQSCNVYYYTMGNEYLGVNKIVDYSYRFGFGEITGIDLPGETGGLVPSPEWKQERRGVSWVGGDTVNLSIGQGDINTTPLQLADMMALIINGGTVYQPHLLKEVRDATTFQVVEQVTPKVLRTTGLKLETIKELKTALRSVVTTGTPKDVMTTRSVQIAAKTGTSETGNVDDKHSWFVAYAPYDYSDINDVVVAVVWIDAVNTWDWWAPKAANILFHGIFTKQDYAQTVKDLQPLWYLSEPETLEEQ